VLLTDRRSSKRDASKIRYEAARLAVTGNSSLRTRYKALRKKVLAYTPFVRRRRHDRIVAKLWQLVKEETDRGLRQKEALGFLFLARPPLASTARIVTRIPPVSATTEELCLFVTHAAGADLKPHVADHVEALLDAGIQVVLITNTDLDPSSLRIPPALAARLWGCLIRENVGYDFGAWAHAYGLIDAKSIRRRLYLVNDSIIGPLDLVAYRKLLQRIRESTADLIGLTCNPDPREHLQSYYLVINEHLLRAPVFDEFMGTVVNMPTKQNVIDCYEICLTAFLERKGFVAAAMFPNLCYEKHLHRNDTVWKWRELMQCGFPFVKSGVLAQSAMADEARRLLPARYLSSELPSPAEAEHHHSSKR
jgi:hypothetical protein